MYEVVSGRAAREASARPKKRGAPGQPSHAPPPKRAVRAPHTALCWVSQPSCCSLSAGHRAAAAVLYWQSRRSCKVPRMEVSRAHMQRHRAGLRQIGANPQAAGAARRYKDEDLSEEEEDADEGDGYADGEGEPCPNCGRIYRCAHAAPCAGHGPLVLVHHGCLQPPGVALSHVLAGNSIW